MPTYTRRTRVDAPLSAVWVFHSRVDGLEALTPGFVNLEVGEVRGPDGEPDPEVLMQGSEIEMSLRPFGVGPRQRWTSVITDREEGNGVAWFRDEMRDGPFPRWKHTHRFRADGDGTVIEDRVVYQLPLGGFGKALGPLGIVGFEPMFRYRHRRTKELLE
ncbi:SRPBCC family protein [Halolamina sp. CBA1230]|uniref:SRPBCC family protein n=1 Tax=Halolamina sp. CBA1230 TaxID=1853690 RepID=UPI0009A1A410|nr:SRPBCC family protein [Halolamina sp. CBA1230]QKY19971.1 SRPBCC family protein [Halolamina sp. CBA1230]